MLLSTPLPRMLASLFFALILALGVALGIPIQPVAAHGCGSTDHTVGQYPWNFEAHYFEYRWTAGNSRFTRWWRVWANEAGYQDTWCGCIDPRKPCVR